MYIATINTRAQDAAVYQWEAAGHAYMARSYLWDILAGRRTDDRTKSAAAYMQRRAALAAADARDAMRLI
jgi:hypothetical protein